MPNRPPPGRLADGVPDNLFPSRPNPRRGALAEGVPDNLFPSGGRPLPRAAQIAAAQEAARRAAAPRTGAAEQMAGAVPISLPRQFLEGGFGQALGSGFMGGGRPNVNPDVINDLFNAQTAAAQNAASQLAAQGGNRPMMNPMQQNPMFGGLGGLASAMSQAGDFSNPTMMGLGQYGRPPVSQLQAMQNAMQNAQNMYNQNMQQPPSQFQAMQDMQQPGFSAMGVRSPFAGQQAMPMGVGQQMGFQGQQANMLGAAAGGNMPQNSNSFGAFGVNAPQGQNQSGAFGVNMQQGQNPFGNFG